jgi:hypothetical protein
MWINCLFRYWRNPHSAARVAGARPGTVRLRVEALEDRALPSSYTAASVSDLIADINAANQAGGANTITLVAGTTFALTAANATTADGSTGLPQIAANNDLTILGNGATIARSTAPGTPAFRLFDVAGTASLQLSNVTLQGGLALGPGGASSEGGAIYNQGTVDLKSVAVQGNIAQGSPGAFAGQTGQTAAGGGIYSAGALTLEGNSIVRNNQALGGNGVDGGTFYGRGGGGIGQAGGNGGDGLGGGIYVGAGTAVLNGVSLTGNTAQGGVGGQGGAGDRPGAGGNGGNGFGGGLDAAGGTVTLLNTSVTSNAAKGGADGQGGISMIRHYTGSNGNPGLGEGGGLYLDAAAVAFLDLFTQSNFKKNHASTSGANIDGSYTTYP